MGSYVDVFRWVILTETVLILVLLSHIFALLRLRLRLLLCVQDPFPYPLPPSLKEIDLTLEPFHPFPHQALEGLTNLEKFRFETCEDKYLDHTTSLLSLPPSLTYLALYVDQ